MDSKYTFHVNLSFHEFASTVPQTFSKRTPLRRQYTQQSRSPYLVCAGAQRLSMIESRVDSVVRQFRTDPKLRGSCCNNEQKSRSDMQRWLPECFVEYFIDDIKTIERTKATHSGNTHE